MKQNAHSSRKNYCYQKLQRHRLMSSLQLSIAFSKHQVTVHFFIIIILSFLICKKNRKQIDGQIGYTVGLEKYSRPTLRDQDQDRKYEDQDQDLRSQDQDQDQEREKIGLECSRDQDRGLEDYIPAYLQSVG